MSTSVSSRSTEFWYADGNVILHAEVGNVLFRIHRGILAANSTFFTNAFSTPPAADATLAEGCEVVALKDDSSRDWEYVLGRIYHPFALTLLEHQPSDIRGIISMMRIGRKYGFDTMFRTAVDKLMNDFAKIDTDIHTPFVGPIYAYKRSHYTGSNLFLAINAALEFDIEAILPVAYYLASFDEIYTAASAGPDQENDRFVNQMEPVALSPQAQKAIMTGKQKLLAAILGFFRARLTQPFQPSSKCQQTRSAVKYWPERVQHCTQAYNSTSEPDPASFCEEKLLDALSNTNLGPTGKLLDGLCLICRVENREFWDSEAERNRLWTELPKFYGLAQSWEELKWYQDENP